MGKKINLSSYKEQGYKRIAFAVCNGEIQDYKISKSSKKNEDFEELHHYSSVILEDCTLRQAANRYPELFFLK